MGRGNIQIGKAAQLTGLSVDAIRFYEKQRLLERPARTEGGFRLFGPHEIHRLDFIRRAQGLGFSLTEIRELLMLERDAGETCSQVRDLLRAKLAAVRRKIRELSVLDKQLSESLRKCERQLGTAERATHCPVLCEIADRSANRQ